MRSLASAVLIVLALAHAGASFAAEPAAVKVLPSTLHKGLVDIEVRGGSLVSTLKSLSLHLDRPLVLELAQDRRIRFVVPSVRPENALQMLARQERLELTREKNKYILREDDEPVVTIDVKDEEVHQILKTVKAQCGIRNLIIDPSVTGKGTFLFRDVPCTLALQTILRSLGLASEIHSGSLVRVATQNQ